MRYAGWLGIVIGLLGGVFMPQEVAAASVKAVTAEIESEFNRNGSHKVQTFTFAAGDRKLKHFTVCAPQAVLEKNSAAYPVIVFCNGTNMPVSYAKAMLEHLASWGFIAIGNEETFSGSGNGAVKALELLLQQNRLPESPFFGKVDTDKIGIAGYSQGGAGAFNAATGYPESGKFKALFAISPINSELAKSFTMRCSYDLSKLKIPVMLTATSSLLGWDETAPGALFSGICDLNFLTRAAGIIKRNSGQTLVVARLSGDDKTHMNVLWETLPYMTAWFAYHLQDNKAAGKFFNAPEPELADNPRWQDVTIYIP